MTTGRLPPSVTRMPSNAVTYSEPIPAKLLVRTESGREWEATPEDIARWGYVSQRVAYDRFSDWLYAVLRRGGAADVSVDETPVNCIRYAVECAIFYDHMPDVDSATNEEDLADNQDTMDEAFALMVPEADDRVCSRCGTDQP